MKVGILAGEMLSPLQVAVCESLVRSEVGLQGLISIAPANWMRRGVRSLGRSLMSRGIVGTCAFLRHRWSPAANVPPAGPCVAVSQSMRRLGRRHRIPYWSIRRVNSLATVEIIRRSGLDLIVAWGAGILRSVLLDTPGVTFLNAHAGELPFFGGMNVVEWAVYEDRPVIGTIHRIDEGIDSGDVLLQHPLDIGKPETVAALRDKAGQEVWSLIPKALLKLKRGEIGFRQQSGPVQIWYRMHPVLKELVERKLRNSSFFAIQQRALAEAHARQMPEMASEDLAGGTGEPCAE